MTERVRAHVFVSGKVQGVYYRANTRDKAQELGVSGWVKNLADGRVEAVFEGDESEVDALIEWCHTGSPAADVTSVEAEYKSPENVSGFEIKR
ncbi:MULTISPECIES: acylphosphatase [unclassified Haladaptatus]|uniref:acylphosphatase n=1 Tax=unclassified Haladaptatus TaxID=2622732 RepID=UPI002FCDE913